MGKPVSGIITVKQPSKVKVGAWYFIRRNGGWYRPKAQGYTDDFAQAGMFSGEDARKYMTGVEGVTAHPIKPMLPLLNSVMRERIGQLAALATIINHF